MRRSTQRRFGTRTAAVLAAAAALLAPTMVSATVNQPVAAADALCDQMRQQHGDWWPCLPPAPTPSIPGQPGTGPGDNPTYHPDDPKQDNPNGAEAKPVPKPKPRGDKGPIVDIPGSPSESDDHHAPPSLRAAHDEVGALLTPTDNNDPVHQLLHPAASPESIPVDQSHQTVRLTGTPRPISDDSYRPAGGCFLVGQNDDGSCKIVNQRYAFSHEFSERMRNSAIALTQGGFATACAGVAGVAASGTGVGAAVAAVGAGALCAGLYEFIKNNPEELGENGHYVLIISWRDPISFGIEGK